MLIYNKNLSVSPVTTHLPLKKVSKTINKKLITEKVVLIDDFYKTFHERRIMAKKVNPLFLTRGVPGTHDTKLLLKCLKQLKNFTKKNLRSFYQ